MSHAVSLKQQKGEVEPCTRRGDCCILGELLIFLKLKVFNRLKDVGSGETVLGRSQTHLRDDGQNNFLRPSGHRTEFFPLSITSTAGIEDTVGRRGALYEPLPFCLVLTSCLSYSCSEFLSLKNPF